MENRPKLEVSSWVAGMVGALIGLASLGVTVWPYVQKWLDSSVPSPTPTPIPSPVPSPSPSEPRVTKKLHQVFKEGIIGNDVQWFDSIVGPPMRKSSSGLRQYQIDDCDVELRVDDDNTIFEAKLFVSPECTFDWSKVRSHMVGMPPPHMLKLGNFINAKRRDWSIAVSCVDSCGNSMPPFAEVTNQVSRAEGLVTVTLGARAAGETNLKAWGKLSKKLEADLGRDAVATGDYQCGNYDLEAAVIGIMEPVDVSYVYLRAMGYSVPWGPDNQIGCVEPNRPKQPKKRPAKE